jgi:hypothetical protein
MPKPSVIKPARSKAPIEKKGVEVKLLRPHTHAGRRHEAGDSIEIFSDSDLEFLKSHHIIEE